ncbi:MAG: site-specific integrase [Nitrosomonas sp.]|nr:site-specific integrase [Nitrosomonas sp.]
MKYQKIKGPQNKNLHRPIGNDGIVRDVIWVRYFRTEIGRLDESLKTSNLTEARDLRDKRIAEFLGQKPRRASKVFLVEEKFPEFLELKKIKSKATYESYRNQWENHLKAFFGGMILDEVTETSWLTYVGSKRILKPKRKFFNDQKTLSGFMHWLHRSGLVSKTPKLQNVDPEIAEGKVYTDEQIQALLIQAPEELSLQIKLALTMGMRIGEIMSLEWDQIDFKKKTIYLPAAKTKIRKERKFGISDTCFQLLKDRKDKSRGLAVFPSPNNADKTQARDGNKKTWARTKQLAGVSKEYRFHWIRHTFLTLAFKKSVNPALICEYAGLSLEEASKTYLHFDEEDTRPVASLVGISI